MLTGGAVRTRAMQLVYNKYRRTHQDGCEFCLFRKGHQQTVKEYRYFVHVRNNFPYAFWDSMGVSKHAMLVPKRHVARMSEFNDRESAEFMRLVSVLEDEGYSLYIRAPQNGSRTVAHLHSHLIMLDNKPKRFLLYIYKPMLLLFWPRYRAD